MNYLHIAEAPWFPYALKLLHCLLARVAAENRTEEYAHDLTYVVRWRDLPAVLIFCSWRAGLTFTSFPINTFIVLLLKTFRQAELKPNSILMS
jgi:hypothetical protein